MKINFAFTEIYHLAITSWRKSQYLSIPEKQWDSVPSGPRLHYNGIELE